MGSFRSSRFLATACAIALLVPVHGMSFAQIASANYAQCSDGIDNDRDGRYDYPQDTDCTSIDDDSEAVDNGVFVTVSDNLDRVSAGEATVYIISLRQQRYDAKLMDVQFHVPPQSAITYASDDGVIRDGTSVFWPKVAVFGGYVRRLSVHVVTSPYARNGDLIVTRVLADGSSAMDTTQVDLTNNIPYVQNQLQVSVTDNRDNVLPSDTLDYSVIVRNPENRSTVTDVRANIPSALRVLGLPDEAQRIGNDILWRGVPFNPGQERVFAFSATVDPRVPNRYPLQVVARAGSVVAYDRTIVGGGDLGPYSLFSSITDNQETARRGDVLRYVVHIDNTSGRLESDANINVAMPIWSEFVSAAEGGTWDGKNVRWQHLQVAPGGSRDLEFAVRVRSDAPNNAALRSTVYVQGIQVTDTTTVVDGASFPLQTYYPRTTATRPLPFYPYGPYRPAAPDIDSSSLRVVKSADRSEIRAGESVTYTLSVSNASDSLIKDIFVDDSYNPTQSTITDSGGASRSADGKLTWRIDQLAPGETRTLTYVSRSASTLKPGTTIRNNALVYSTQMASTPGDYEDVDVNASASYYNDYDYSGQIMPRTGVMDELFAPLEDTGKFLTPLSAAADGNALPLVVWIAVVSAGIAGGAFTAKRFIA